MDRTSASPHVSSPCTESAAASRCFGGSPSEIRKTDWRRRSSPPTGSTNAVRKGFRGKGKCPAGVVWATTSARRTGEHHDSLEHHEQLGRREPMGGASLHDRG